MVSCLAPLRSLRHRTPRFWCAPVGCTGEIRNSVRTRTPICPLQTVPVNTGGKNRFECRGSGRSAGIMTKLVVVESLTRCCSASRLRSGKGIAGCSPGRRCCLSRSSGAEFGDSRNAHCGRLGYVAKEVEHTDDGRYIVVDGRRWRATDPDIPADRNADLRSILMAWRREVRRTDGAAAARAGVQAAKVALGERGTPWWEQSGDERRARWEADVPRPDTGDSQ